MTDEAISTFLFLTDISYDYRLISRKTFIERIIKLYTLNGLDVSDFYEINQVEENQEEFETNNYQGDNDYRKYNLESIGLKNAIKINEELYSKDNVLYFITRQQGKYCNWKFRELDADDNPSIPHRHGIELKKLKLDPYRALIYDINKGFDKPISKEDNDLIIYLWNNNDFRNCATLAIKHHINSLNKHPLYWTDYRRLTHSPLRLPRRRR